MLSYSLQFALPCIVSFSWPWIYSTWIKDFYKDRFFVTFVNVNPTTPQLMSSGKIVWNCVILFMFPFFIKPYPSLLLPNPLYYSQAFSYKQF